MLNLRKESWVPALYPLKLLGLVKTNTDEEQYSELKRICDLLQIGMSGELLESKQTQNLGSSPVNLQLSPNFGHICGWSLRRATAMLHTQGRNTLHRFTSMDMLKRSFFIISATKVGSKRLQQMWWRHLQKANWIQVVGKCSCYSR